MSLNHLGLTDRQHKKNFTERRQIEFLDFHFSPDSLVIMSVSKGPWVLGSFCTIL
jgi:hypothetical protein